jgi:RNA polymerase subunit RPABC4/transcription elongation factor Spt4
MKKNVCKKCKMFVGDADKCPGCKGNAFTTVWQGKITFLDSKKSFIAQQMGVEVDGEYAIKIR